MSGESTVAPCIHRPIHHDCMTEMSLVNRESGYSQLMWYVCGMDTGH